MSTARHQTSPLVLHSRTIERPTDAGSTLVAGLDGTAPARVDGGGLVSVADARWSVDWWIGADDRWHLPAREPAVRQRRLGPGPVIETSLRVPSGDVVHTVYPVVVAGGTVTVIEIRNDSPVPVALALAIRPYGAHAAGGGGGDRGDGDDRGDGAAGGAGFGPGPGADARRDLALALGGAVVEVDGAAAVVLPRAPNEAGATAEADLLETVTAGGGLAWDGPVAGPGANAVCLYPLPHKTSLRFVLPGPGGPAATSFGVDQLTDAAASARGWKAVVERASRFEFADPGVTELAGAARARLLIGAEHLPERVVAVEPGAGLSLQGLAAGGHLIECGWSLEALARSFPAALAAAPVDAAAAIVGAAVAAEALADRELTERLLEPMTQLTHLVERAGDRPATATARRGLALLAELTGQPKVAAELRHGLAASPDPELDLLSAMAAAAAPAGRWDVDDSEPDAARYWLAAHRFLVRPGQPAGEPYGPVRGPSVELLPVFPAAWRGGGVEVHQAPVSGVRVSFAIRWHGFRPALLWEVSGGTAGGLSLRCPGLDPEWQTAETKGETLLAGTPGELPDAPAPGDSFS